MLNSCVQIPSVTFLSIQNFSDTRISLPFDEYREFNGVKTIPGSIVGTVMIMLGLASPPVNDHFLTPDSVYGSALKLRNHFVTYGSSMDDTCLRDTSLCPRKGGLSILIWLRRKTSTNGIILSNGGCAANSIGFCLAYFGRAKIHLQQLQFKLLTKSKKYVVSFASFEREVWTHFAITWSLAAGKPFFIY